MYEELKEEVIQRLKSLNYTVVQTDKFALQFIIDKVEQDIKNKTNQDEVPSELHFVFIDRVCGEFLRSMMAYKLMSDEQIDSVVASIKEGDTNISFDVNSSPQAKFDAYTKYLANSGSNDFAKFRRFVW